MALTRAQARAARRRHDARLSAAAKNVQRLGRDIAFHEPRAASTRRGREMIRNYFLMQAQLRAAYGPGITNPQTSAHMSDLYHQNRNMHAYHQGSLNDLTAASVGPLVELAHSARPGGRQKRGARRGRARRR